LSLFDTIKSNSSPREHGLYLMSGEPQKAPLSHLVMLLILSSRCRNTDCSSWTDQFSRWPRCSCL